MRLPKPSVLGGKLTVPQTYLELWPWMVFAVVGVAMAYWVASPSYAWWFTAQAPLSSIAPTHPKGLVVSPIVTTIVPQFVLEPLSPIEVEEPPTALADTAPVANKIAVTPVKSEPAVAAASTSSAAEQMLQAVNQQRQAHGLKALSLNTQLSASAQAYAQRMSSEGFFAHKSPEGTTFTQRNIAAGYSNWTWMGENIAYGQANVSEVISDWMESKLHRDNILDERAEELGVGKAGGGRTYWVQEFGAR